MVCPAVQGEPPGTCREAVRAWMDPRVMALCKLLQASGFTVSRERLPDGRAKRRILCAVDQSSPGALCETFSADTPSSDRSPSGADDEQLGSHGPRDTRIGVVGDPEVVLCPGERPRQRWGLNLVVNAFRTHVDGGVPALAMPLMICSSPRAHSYRITIPWRVYPRRPLPKHVSRAGAGRGGFTDALAPCLPRPAVKHDLARVDAFSVPRTKWVSSTSISVTAGSVVARVATRLADAITRVSLSTDARSTAPVSSPV
jgi:hypothetical protein